jgi:glycine/D-amino acid oxidase-like deaminating enzyme
MEGVIIVGGGLSGLGCAKRLKERGINFKLITEDVGGRVRTSPDGTVNYGAYYITADCKNMLSYASRLRAMRFWDFHFHAGARHYHFGLGAMFRHAPALLRLAFDLIKFRRRFVAMRRRAKDFSRQELIEGDPLLKKYYHQQAGEYIKEKRLENVVKEYFESVLWASFFEDPRKVPTFVLLQCLLPMIIPTYSFVLDFGKITESFKDDIILDSIVSIRRENDVIKLASKNGKIYECKKLVLATPMTITNQLIRPQKIKGGIEISFLHLRGQIKKTYDLSGYNFFPSSAQAAIAREADGSYLYFYKGENRVNDYFERVDQIITAKKWEPALILLGDVYINLNPEPGIYLANDHDVASTEDAFLNGIYIAKKLLT